MSNKSIEEIEEYILNIGSYEAEVTITVNSNKNQNTYKANQKFIRENNIYKQEIIEPENIKGITFLYDGTNLKIENTNLSLSKIYENYNYMGSNDLSLIEFINNYKESNEKTVNEKEGTLIFEAKIKNGNKYKATKKLYINKSNATPIKLEIEDIAQNTVIYILYNEIKINNLQKEDIIAFKLSNINEDI